jgi:hypothetical protein
LSGLSADPPVRLIHVRINIAGRLRVTCLFPVERSAWQRLDNCHADKAVTNAKQLADLLRSANVPVMPPGLEASRSMAAPTGSSLERLAELSHARSFELTSDARGPARKV